MAAGTSLIHAEEGWGPFQPPVLIKCVVGKPRERRLDATLATFSGGGPPATTHDPEASVAKMMNDHIMTLQPDAAAVMIWDALALSV